MNVLPNDADKNQTPLMLTPELIDTINRFLWGMHHGEIVVRIVQGKIHAIHHTNCYLTHPPGKKQ